jgi:hypothetical protein
MAVGSYQGELRRKLRRAKCGLDPSVRHGLVGPEDRRARPGCSSGTLQLYGVDLVNLVARVQQALSDRSVHPTEFERCACALLQPRYPGLSAVESGHDFGRDGDIYFPFGPDDTISRGRLLVTTGNSATNLRTGLRRMREERVTSVRCSTNRWKCWNGRYPRRLW